MEDSHNDYGSSGCGFGSDGLLCNTTDDYEGSAALNYTDDYILCDHVCYPEECYNYTLCVSEIIDYIYPTPYEWFIVFLYCVVFVVGLTGNFLVCFAVWRNETMRTVTNYFIVNLALADFLVILVCLAPTAVENIVHTWYVGGVLCKIIKYLQSVSVSVSVFTLSCISIERWYAICHPLKFKSTPHRAKVMIFLIWFIALIITMPTCFTMEIVPNANLPDDFPLLALCKPTWSHSAVVGYQCFSMVALYFLPLLLMFVSYFQIARCLWSTNIPTECSRDRLEPSSCPTGAETQSQSRRKAAKMLIAVVVMFAICYLPVHLINIFVYAHVMDGMGDEFTLIALFSQWLCYFNSAVNPLIYNFMSAKFRKEFKNVCASCLCRRGGRIARHNTASYSYKYTNSLNTRTSHLTSPANSSQKRLTAIAM